MIYSVLNPDMVNKTNLFRLDSIYAHGKLEQILDYDVIGTDSVSTINNLMTYQSDEFIDSVKDDRGNTHTVRVITWPAKSEHRRLRRIGYVVLEGDEESIKFAKDQQKKRPIGI